jgi:O-antigen ligase
MIWSNCIQFKTYLCGYYYSGSLNSQIVLIKDVLKAKLTFIFFVSLIPVSLFFKAGFVSVSVIWFFAICLYNSDFSIKACFKSNYILLFPMFLYALYLIGIFYSEDLDIALNIIVRKIHLLLVPLGFLIVNRKLSNKDIDVILLLFLLACILSTAFCLFHAAYNVIRFGIPIYQPGCRDCFYFYSYLLTEPINISPVYFSMFCNLALLIALNTSHVRKEVYRAIIWVYLAVFIVICGSIAGIVCACILTMLWLMYAGFKKIIACILIGLFIIISISICTTLFKEQIRASFKFNYTDESGHISDHTADKLLIWKSAIKAIAKTPATGYGTSDGQKAIEEIYDKNDLTREKVDSLNAHNEFLSATLDVGISGFIVLTVMLVLPFVQAVKSSDIFAIGFILLSLSFFFVEAVLERQKGIVFFSFFYSLLFAHLGRNNSK